jgi:hypothetical protein
MNPGSIGVAIILMCSIVGLIISGWIWLCFCSHAFLVVLTESSVGSYEVSWPDESFSDWMWKPFYCVGLLLFWMTAGSLIFVPLALVNIWLGVVVAALFVWFAYPIGLLCVMDARSSLAVFYMPLMLRLPSQWQALLFVNVITLVPMAGAIALAVLTVQYAIYWAIPAAVVFPLALLFYTRCWGRLAWLVLNVKRRKRREKAPAEAKYVTCHDPWALPREEPIPEVDVEIEEEPPPPVRDEWGEALNPTPYSVAAGAEAEAAGAVETGVVASDAPAANPQVFNHEQYYAEYRKREEERRARAEGRKPGQPRRRKATFASAFGADLWPFFGQDRTLRAFLGIGLMTFFVLVFLRIVLVIFQGLIGA